MHSISHNLVTGKFDRRGGGHPVPYKGLSSSDISEIVLNGSCTIIIKGIDYKENMKAVKKK